MTDTTCANCTHYTKLSPGYVAICFHRWKDLPWNAAVPLTSADNSCESFKAKALAVTNGEL